jgi:hypothetical protein
METNMQTVYRVNTISGFKPWRSGGPYLITDKTVFDLVKACEDEGDFYRIRAPGAIEDEEHPDYNEDDSLVEWLYCQQPQDKIEMPYILADEITFYVE